MAQVFISYSRRDSEFVDRLETDLRAAGIETWVDRARIEAGDGWVGRIQDAIVSSSAMLYIASPEALNSAWVNDELYYALTRGKLILPVIYRTEVMPLILARYQGIDFRQSYQEGLDRLIEALHQFVVPGTPLTPAAARSKGYVFISYAEQDSEFVSGLRGFLKDKGYAYWDYQESDRDYHKQLSHELEEIIQGAAATLSILSPDWKRSKWVPKEYMYSEEVGVPVFLLRFRDMGPTLAIAGVPYIDFVEDVQAGFTKLDHELRRKGLI